MGTAVGLLGVVDLNISYSDRQGVYMGQRELKGNLSQGWWRDWCEVDHELEAS